MTVCIASMSVSKAGGTNWPMVTMATDRMLTAGDIQFEPYQSKLFDLHTGIVALFAGSASFQASVLVDARGILDNEINVTVKRAAKVYSEVFSRYRREEAELKYLRPLGLTIESFIQNQKTMPQETIDNLTYKLRVNVIDASTIIAGVDPNGQVHIYTIEDPGEIACQDMVGFAAIGAGEWHAQSLFMFNKYVATKPFSESLFFTYAAKKRAEVAPGVGTVTDMTVIDSSAVGKPDSVIRVGDDVIDKLDIIYREYHQAQEDNLEKAIQKNDKFINELLNKEQD